MSVRPAAFSSLIGCLLVCAAHAQTFEVAAIKPNTDLTQHQSGIGLGNAGTITVTNVSLRFLIAFAYEVRDYQVTGGPKWIDSDRWDIVAKPSAEEAAAEPVKPDKSSTDHMRIRLRALLADRFQVVVHPETKEMPIYALKVGKDGPKLETAKAESGAHMYRNGEGIEAGKATMKMFADLLSNMLGRPVVEKTGLTGEYDFKFKLEPPAAADANAPTDLAGAVLIDAVREQLGMKLEATKGPVQVFTVEHAEKASAN